MTAQRIRLICPYETVSRTGSISRDPATTATRIAGCRRPATSLARPTRHSVHSATTDAAIEVTYASGQGSNADGTKTSPANGGYVNGSGLFGRRAV